MEGNTTYREIVYMVKDLLKDSSDDTYFTEEHIMFLFNKYRSMFIRRYYKEESKIPETLKQTVCVDLQRDNNCIIGKETLKSVDKIPEFIRFDNNSTGGINLGLGDYYSNYRLTFVSFERFPYTNSNSFLKNIVYVAISPDRRLNVNIEGNSDASYLKQLKITGVFENPSEASKYSCEEAEAKCDDLDKNIYLDNTLQTIVIKAIVQDLSFGLYRPKDNVNNAKDDISNNSVDNYIRNNNRAEMSNNGEE